ncbi:hypothetical protein TrRE_jg3951 [Triparma retinervis]|uniref:Glycoside hydrolase family 5 domain-containing protein n=1 Tax=Triparma retinervis TaxID=2557542 RepID=A0A9W7E7Y2_9STRA|nr:hypothetical protein TrRE_jg3951 [Triparma retinervis]
MKLGLFASALLLAIPATVSAAATRRVKINGEVFVDANSGETLLLTGVSGDTFCQDDTGEDCAATGTCHTCSTFNQADIDNIKSMGWTTIRLGVTWAGAQPRDEGKLDADFVARLHDILDLTDANGIHVILDNHGDMVTSAGCGNGVPVWFAQKAAPDLIGKPLTTALPYSLFVNVKDVGGYDHCGDNEDMWAEHAGDPNYNLLNQCCIAMNGPNPAGLGYTRIAQETMTHMVKEGPGRDDFVRYWKLLADEVKDHPSAFAFELMNEPMTIHRKQMFDCWKETAEEIIKIVPDASISLADVGEGAVYPSWLGKWAPDLDISSDTSNWIKDSENVFYAWHYYGQPSDPKDAVKNVQALGKSWNVPTMLTEFMDCGAMAAAEEAKIGWNYWHYSAYCNHGADSDHYFANKTEADFGACILGWGGGNSQKTCD